MNRIDHLGIAVENLEESIAAYTALGLELEGTEEVPEQKVSVAMFPCAESRIELLQSTDPEGPIGRFTAKRGPGICYRFIVNSMRKTNDILQWISLISIYIDISAFHPELPQKVLGISKISFNPDEAFKGF